MFLGFLRGLYNTHNIQFIEPFVCHEPLTSAQCTATAVELGSVLINFLVQIFFSIDGIKWDTLLKRTMFQITYICGSLKVNWGNVVGFPEQLHLL